VGSPTEALGSDVFSRLHPHAIEAPASVRRVLVRLWREGVLLRRGVNRRIDPEIATLSGLDGRQIFLKTRNFEKDRRDQILLNFDLDGRPYFFAASVVSWSDERAVAEMPKAIYTAERRDRTRACPGGRVVRPGRVRLSVDGSSADAEAEVVDISAGGIGLSLRQSVDIAIGASVAVEFLDGDQVGKVTRGRLCHSSPSPTDQGRQRIGVNLLDSAVASVRVVDAESVLSWQRAREAWKVVAAGANARSQRTLGSLTGRTAVPPAIEIIDFRNAEGERIRAIVDRTDRARQGKDVPVVLVPPAWGRTKETLLPLARTIVATFENAREPAAVIRFDGIRKRGESHNDPDCRSVGREHHAFTFSQGVRDILSVLDQLEKSREFSGSPVLLVTFSAAAIDGRRALLVDGGRRVKGWVSVVGSPDIQSMMRVVSGGVDYVAGVERGVRFGLQEILGVEVDIDRAGRDALEEKLAFLEDSCRDFQSIAVPVTWFHGRHDAWMDLDRVKLALKTGDPSRRKLILAPTGHQLRSSREAIRVFQDVAREVALLLGRHVRPRIPDLVDLDARRRAERARLPRTEVDRRKFWERYLLGRQGALGIELMTSASAYQRFMRAQIEAMALSEGDRVADLGAGTGAFPLALRGLVLNGWVTIDEFDYIIGGLRRARQRLTSANALEKTSFVACDLGGARAASIPARTGTYSAVLASLFLSYVDEVDRVLAEVLRILKPGGRFIASGLRPDADVSKLFIDATQEMSRGEGASELAAEGGVDLGKASREFLNDATRLVDLEEHGVFKFWDAVEFTHLLERSGFLVERTWKEFGDPPQAVVVSARKPL
jgi:ubiquinone/menaquinone biosynthesis C-methylase UbiE